MPRRSHEDQLRVARENADTFAELYTAALVWAVDENATPGHVLANLCIDRDTFGKLFKEVLLPYLSEPCVEGMDKPTLGLAETQALLQGHIMGLAAGVIIGSSSTGTIVVENEDGKPFDSSIKTPKARLRHNDPRLRRNRRGR